MDFFQKNNKNIYYELKYLGDKFKLHNLLLFFFALLGLVVVNLSSTQAFFIGDASPIPKNWTFFKKSSNVRIISIFIIVIPALSVFITESINQKVEINNISDITYKVTFPFFERDLNIFHDFLCTKYQLSDASRIYILIPIRQKFVQWNLKIIANTQNLNNREKEISLALDEGVHGYVFQKINYNYRNKSHYIPFKEARTIPPGFINYSHNNQSLIRDANIGYLIIPIFDKDFLSGLLVVDTDNNNDLAFLQNEDLQEDIFNWIGSEPIFLTLIWRLSNRGNKP